MIYYPQAQPDYYNKKYSCNGYLNTLRTFKSFDEKNSFLSLSDEGFKVIGKVQWVWENFKGILGFENSTDRTKINAEILKFIDYGFAREYYQNDNINTFKIEVLKKFEDNIFLVGREVINAFTHVDQARNILENYCIRKESALKPAFWNRFFVQAIKTPYSEFGSTHLALAEQLIRARGKRDEKVDLQIIQHYKSAANIHNSVLLRYRNELVDSFNKFEAKRQASKSIQTQAAKVYLLLAKRDSILRFFSSASNFYAKANSGDTNLLKMKHKIAWLEASLKGDEFAQAVTLERELSTKKFNSELLSRYTAACFDLGNHFLEIFENSCSFVGSSYFNEALEYCNKALLNSKRDQQDRFVISLLFKVNNLLKNKRIDVAQSLLAIINEPLAKSSASDMYVTVCMNFGDYFFNKKETGIGKIFSSKGNTRKTDFLSALGYYEKALLKANASEKLRIEEKLLKSIDLKNLDEAQALIEMMDKVDVSGEFNDRYVEIYEKIADYNLKKSTDWSTKAEFWFTIGKTSSKTYIQVAIDCYKNILERASENKKKEILKKLLGIIKSIRKDVSHLTLEEYFYNLGNFFLQKGEYYSAAQFFLIAMQSYNKTDLYLKEEGQQCIKKLLEAITKLYLAEKNCDNCLALLNSGFVILGKIKGGLLEYKVELTSFRESGEGAVQTSIPELSTTLHKDTKSENVAFNGDVGSNLYFLKAELLQASSNASLNQICLTYRRAADLAPSNPFGIDSSYMEDDFVGSDEDTLNLIKSHRACAIEWGAASQLKLLGFPNL